MFTRFSGRTDSLTDGPTDLNTDAYDTVFERCRRHKNGKSEDVVRHFSAHLVYELQNWEFPHCIGTEMVQFYHWSWMSS